MRNLMITMSMLSLIGLAGSVNVAIATELPSFSVENVSNGVYVHHGKHLDIDTGYQGDICNISFVVGSKGVAVIDTGGSLKVGNQLRDAIRKVTPLPVLYVINTHVHPDHIYGNAAFVADKPQFVGHDKLASSMHARHDQYERLNAKLLLDDAKGSAQITPTVIVKTSLELDLGDRKLVVTAHPVAHTNTDISVVDSKTNTLFTGDLLFIERTPVVEADVKGLITELEKFKAFSYSQVVPGHGPTTKDGMTAFSNAQRYLSQLLADIRTNIKQNQGMEKAMDTAAATEKDKWLLFDVANRRNVNTIYPALEWE
jgi:quinoprotein relay system zinc metallohydrolase 2